VKIELLAEARRAAGQFFVQLSEHFWIEGFAMTKAMLKTSKKGSGCEEFLALAQAPTKLRKTP
jgi:hypothetical protein